MNAQTVQVGIVTRGHIVQQLKLQETDILSKKLKLLVQTNGHWTFCPNKRTHCPNS